jgi:signal transduction histidine kinase
MRTLVRVLAIGFAAVLVLLAAAAVIGAISARTVARNSADLEMDQLVITRLLDEVEREQQVLNSAFYRLSRTPEMVDRARVLLELDSTDSDIDQLVARAAGSPDAATWQNLHHATLGFSTEARQLLTLKKLPEASSRDLFRRHEDVTLVVAQLVDHSYSRAQANQQIVDRRVSHLAAESSGLVGGCFAIALVCAAFTVRGAARIFSQMEAQSGELSRVSFRMLEAQEAVARRFAHELHDELGGSLTAIKTNLTALAADPSDRSRLDDCTKLVETSISNVRELSQLLRPTILDDFGLDASLRWLVERFQERTRIEVDYRSTFDGRLPDETETHLFRIVQEALTNIARHSGATKVSVFLRTEKGPDDGVVRLTLSDNGHGLSQGARKGMGLSGMRARARSAGGELKLDSKPGQGLTIEVWAPRTSKPTPAETPAKS